MRRSGAGLGPTARFLARKGAISCNTNAANAPWGWDDGNDVPARGELATDPANLVSAYFAIPETLSRTYSFNPYR